MKEHRLFNTLDRPKYMLYWPITDCCGFLMCAFSGALIGHWFVGTVVGFSYMYLMSKVRRRIGSKAISHWLYFHLPHPKAQLPSLPPSHVREILG
jgi:type IV conjugative transfer system protein TraL